MEALTRFVSGIGGGVGIDIGSEGTFILSTVVVVLVFIFVFWTAWKMEKQLHPDKGEWRVVIPTYMLLSVDLSEMTMEEYVKSRMIQAGFDMNGLIHQTFRDDIQSYVYTQSY